MSQNQVKCAVCGSVKDVVCALPTAKQILQKWADILCFPSLLQTPRQKKLCLDHFEQKWHFVLRNPICKRSPFIFPVPYDSSSTSTSSCLDPVRSGESLKRALPFDTTLHNKSKKCVNYDLLLRQKKDEISALTQKVKSLKLEVTKLSKEAKTKQSYDQILSESHLGENSKLLIKLLLCKKSVSTYDKNEKSLCQSLYYKNAGAYKHIRALLDNKLPSVRTLKRWHELSDLDVGIVKHVVAHLIKKGQELKAEDKELILLFDEMDGKRSLIYDSKRDLLVGFEDLYGRRPKLVKKFLTVMVRGLNNTIGNLIIANFATANGITGI